MAPAAKTRTKAKTKLSQTRLSTTTTTPRKPSTPVSSSFSAKPKVKQKPNQSILSFFKKEPVDEPSLFIGEGIATIGGGDGVEEEEGGEDIHSASPPSKDELKEGEERFNENGGSVKRRRVNSPSGSGSGSGLEKEETAKKEGGATEMADSTTPKPISTWTPVQKKKRAGNPFLEDESSSDEDSDNDEKEAPGSATERVRTHKSVITDDETEQAQRCGPARLTNGVVVDRKVPLLRRETSGADFENDDNNELPVLDDGNFGDYGLDTFDDDDFMGEELRAMRYMEEQARLEMGEEEDLGADEECEGMMESCPVCNGSLAGATPNQATAHVNACLDGNPTPLPKPPDEDVVDGSAVGKRFARAAVPRPGQPNPISLGDDAGEGSSSSAFAKLMSGHAEDAAWATAAAAENASRGKPAYTRTCPFYKIMPGFSICVDAFRYGAVEGCRAYFLSHFHSDHYIGLTANWTHGPIYCSKVTGALVKSQLKTAAKYVVELEFEETVPVPETNGVTVTMIPANHCPGSSMFLFEKVIGGGGKTQRILHCGDFRACPEHIEHPQLRPETVDAISGKTKQQKIDVCYLDTTYLNPRYSFPPQSDVTRACAELCARLNKGLLENDDSEWETLLRRLKGGARGAGTRSVSKFFPAAATSSSSSKPSPPETPTSARPTPNNAFTALQQPPSHNRNRLLVVCGTYSIGKERICVAIAQALNTKIYAAPAKLRMCALLDDPELTSLLTPNPRDAQVHMQMLTDISPDTLGECLESYKGWFGKVIGFRGSGWNYRPPSSSSTKQPRGGSGAAVNANLPPSSLPTAQLLHGPGWRTRFGLKDMVPQRGSGKEVLCFGVPYSEHSSFWELAVFLMALRVEKVVPTVNVGSEGSRRRMKGWVERWVGERRRGGFVRVLRKVVEGGDGEGEEVKDGGGAGKEVGLWEGKDGRGGVVYW